MVNIICLKWGTKYGPEYVNKLYRAVNRNVTVPYNFICFTDNDSDLECHSEAIPSENIKLPHWWNKLSLFSRTANLKGSTIFFDLDTIIIDNIDHIVSCEKDFVILQDFYRWNRNKGLQSSIMMWNPENYYFIWDKFIQNVRKHVSNPLGDQGFIELCVDRNKVDTWQNLFPGEFVSYKVHCKKGPPKDTKIIVFHGNPRPHKAIDKWVKENW